MKLLKRLTDYRYRKYITLSIFALFLIGIAITIINRINAKNNEFKTANNPQKARELSLSLKEEVGKVYVLPNEDPIIATVTDTNVLPNDPFYSQARNGDKILLFQISQKAILYRPSIKKVVEVGTLPAPKEIPVDQVAGAATQNQDAVINSSSSAQPQQPKIIFNPVNKNGKTLDKRQ